MCVPCCPPPTPPHPTHTCTSMKPCGTTFFLRSSPPRSTTACWRGQVSVLVTGPLHSVQLACAVHSGFFCEGGHHPHPPSSLHIANMFHSWWAPPPFLSTYRCASWLPWPRIRTCLVDSGRALPRGSRRAVCQWTPYKARISPGKLALSSPHPRSPSTNMWPHPFPCKKLVLVVHCPWGG